MALSYTAECALSLACARWVARRLSLSGANDSASWPAASPGSFAPLGPLPSLPLCPPYRLLHNRARGEVALAVRGLGLTRPEDYRRLLDADADDKAWWRAGEPKGAGGLLVRRRGERVLTWGSARSRSARAGSSVSCTGCSTKCASCGGEEEDGEGESKGRRDISHALLTFDPCWHEGLKWYFCICFCSIVVELYGQLLKCYMRRCPPNLPSTGWNEGRSNRGCAAMHMMELKPRAADSWSQSLDYISFVPNYKLF
ncbi:hypothetical protein BDA96_02G446900 [Sorghum bicolor]|uniref:Uncharacterized protein n=2 Tax=Sorghum bicolor TaxID=4558 RepID=A0A921UWH0_SORBI|nr:hypothetical protein BDA96_02G446900 [Sorghum bicolor]OQU90541.1 hypothetical protein SORBI_3002G426650 [Sorghum bicolor]